MGAEWEYTATRAPTRRHVNPLPHLNELGADGWELVLVHGDVFYMKRRKSTRPTVATLTIQGAHMPFTVDTTDGAAVLQFTDDHGTASAGPKDSVTGAPIVPVFTSDNDAVFTVGVGVESTPGLFTAPITVHGVGTANVGVAALVNSDGTPVVEIAGANVGQPFALPASVAVTVDAAPATGATLTITG